MGSPGVKFAPAVRSHRHRARDRGSRACRPRKRPRFRYASSPPCHESMAGFQTVYVPVSPQPGKREAAQSDLADRGGRHAHVGEPHHVLVPIDGDIVALPIGQRGIVRSSSTCSTRPITIACEWRSMISSTSHSIAANAPTSSGTPERAVRPLRAGKPVGALEPALAGEALGDVDLVGGQDVDAEDAVARCSSGHDDDARG